MNVLGAIMAIKVIVTGANSVNATLNQVKKSLRSVNLEALSLGYALTSAGSGLLKESVQAFEGFEKARRSFIALSNEAEGNRLANWLSDYSLQANTSTEALFKAAQAWISSTGDTTKVYELITALERLGGLGKSADEIRRTGKAIADIQGAGTFRAQERNQLVNAGIPLNRVAQELGINNIGDALGKSADEVVPAILRALNKLPKEPPLLFQRIENSIEHIQRALIPTGRLFTTLFSPIVSVADVVISVFETMNRWMGGLPGAVVAIGLLVGGLNLLVTALKATVFWQTALNVLQFPWSSFLKIYLTLINVYSKIIGLLKVQVTWQAILAALQGNWVGLAVAGAIAAGAGVAWAFGAFDSKPDQTVASTPAGKRPYHRSATENFFYDRLGAMTGA